jgi:uncharacterized protein (DUF2235 family)
VAKNIVICCDGSGNEFGESDTNSNVVKLYYTLIIDTSQVGYYHPGVGTMGAPTTRTSLGKQLSRLGGPSLRQRAYEQYRRQLSLPHEYLRGRR